ncbi:proton-coupled folate transporter [Drosophila obscura]|uniref:proton-coupled folate transporter n=1 Tax=Drosophila obscura TaxID=7282 RepID=UPI001BB15D4D|nr:proton-coupled folate transporter [Drosophila obscura]XP_022213763.2 proton-coupled folate transporter [Drosophila obscura]XP_022213771.2 proton-coupled folate transporter [Drosophila obscura]XP_022213780.2 proton-coupled folate transporter [Drosophila obscura]XP_022213790.2 proton-coupled folate transporter [Drosophila obscura]
MVQKATLAQLKSLQWGRLFNMFYIEPVVFMLIFSHVLSGTIMRNQLIYQTCTVIFQYNETDCKLLDSKNTSTETQAIETELQSYVANMFLIRTLFESIVPAICGLFIGSWSDHYGRKPLLMVSMIGFSASSLVSSIICWMSSYYMVNPWWYTVAAVPHSMLGGLCVFSVAASCFISDTTDVKTRPYRMMFMELILFVALTSGSLLSGFVYAATSAAFVQSLSCLMIVLATLFIVLYLPESLGMRQDDEDIPERQKDAAVTITISDQQLNVSEKSEKLAEKPSQLEESAPGLFSLKHVRGMFSTCFKRRENNAHSIIWLVTFAGFVSIFVGDGVMTVMYLYVRQQFHMTVREYTIFETVSQSVPMIGALLGFLILKKIFGLSVVALALLSLVSEILSSLAKGFAFLSWHLYLSVALGVFRSIQGPMCRTIVSNIVPASDTGKLFAIGNIVQSLAPFVAAPLYTAIYKGSLASHPGGFNFLSAALYLISFILIGCVLRIKFKHRTFYAKLLK